MFLQTLDEFVIYHYGTYEIQALKSISKKLSPEHQEFLKKIIDSSFNVLNIFTHNIYPPTYSNSLKDIARFLKFEWTDKNASGLQSTIWRYNWEMTHNEELKLNLLQYNLEDCSALIKVKEWVASIGEKVFDEPNKHFQKITDIKHDSYHKWGNTKFELPALDQINRLAHFDYQQQKIFLKSNKNIKKALRRKQSNSVNKIDTIIHLLPEKCPACHKSSNRFELIKKGEQVTIDLKSTKNGIKKLILLYRGGQFKCCNCKKIFSPHKLKKGPHYGHNLIAWAINLQIVLTLS